MSVAHAWGNCVRGLAKLAAKLRRREMDTDRFIQAAD